MKLHIATLLKSAFSTLEPSQYHHLLPVIYGIESKEYPELCKILQDCGLQPQTIFSHYALWATQKDHKYSTAPGLFINRVLPFLKTISTANEFQKFLNEFLMYTNPLFYAHETWAFKSVETELLEYWSIYSPEQLEEALSEQRCKGIDLSGLEDEYDFITPHYPFDIPKIPHINRSSLFGNTHQRHPETKRNYTTMPTYAHASAACLSKHTPLFFGGLNKATIANRAVSVFKMVFK